MARVWQIAASLLLGVSLLAAPVAARAGEKATKSSAKESKTHHRAVRRDAKGRKILKMNALEIEGEHDTPNVINIIEWTPEKDVKIKDKATDDLDRVFTGIRSLNRQFDQELKGAPDVKKIVKDAEVRKEEQRLFDAEKPPKKERARKTSLR